MRKEKPPEAPTDIVLEGGGALNLTKEGVEKLEAEKATLERGLEEMDQKIKDYEEHIEELRRENARREQLGSSALLKDDIRQLKEEIKNIEKQRQLSADILESIKDALFKFGTAEEKNPEELN